MIFLFVADPIWQTEVEEDYVHEWRTVQELGVKAYKFLLFDLEEGRIRTALREIPIFEQPTLAIYRGWMMNKKVYMCFEKELKTRNIYLINSIDSYLETHYLPHAYDKIQDISPQISWISGQPKSLSERELVTLLKEFGSKSLIVKDYVKSRKQDWEKACFIPNASQIDQALEVIQNFCLLQEDLFQGGLVLREFVPLELIGHHPVSKAPIYQEFRIFYYQHQRICAKPYWGQMTDEIVPYEIFDKVANRFSSCFFTMDVAKLQDGSWVILEMWDGQVSDLPPNEDPIRFYGQILEISQNGLGG